MKLKISKLLISSSILSLPGFLSIFLSLFSISVHLNTAGAENYGNYIIFHFLLIISSILNFGIGKSIAVSINNYPKNNKEIAFQGIKYTFFIIVIIFFLKILISIEKISFLFKLIDSSLTNYFFLGIALSILYSSFEGIFQGNQKFKTLSAFNLIFFSFSISIPSLMLIYDQKLSLNELITFSLMIKILTIVLMFLSILVNNLISMSNNQILFKNLKKNAKWLTLNNILIQFYDLFDKYLIKIFLGPIAIATYSIPQQLTGKLSILSKGFSAYLLTTLSRRKYDKMVFNYSLNIFLKILPIIIFLIFPLYEFFLKAWLGDQFSEDILLLTKIFSLCAIFSCTSHLLITNFEASKTLYKNLKIEFYLMPFFVILLYFLTSNKFSLIEISFLILFKEFILLILRLNLLRKIIQNITLYYFYIFFFLSALYISINFENLLLIIMIFLIIGNFIKNDKFNI